MRVLFACLAGMSLVLVACEGGRRDATNVSEGRLTPAVADPAQYVDPFIGSYPPGFTTPGASWPHGMVAAGPDTEGPVNYGGYSVQNTLLTGISQTHMSAGVYQGGQFPLLAVDGAPASGDLFDYGYTNPVPAYSVPFNKLTQVAEPGYYKVDLLAPAATMEVTVTPHAAMHRVVWLAASAPGLVLAPSRDLKGYHPAGLVLREDGVLLGQVLTSGPEHTVYFALEADGGVQVENAQGEPLSPGEELQGEDLLVVLRPAEPQLQVRIGLSYVDRDGALNNLRAEMPSWDFDSYRSDARQRWNTELGRIEVTGGREDRLRSFYTALYRTLKFPTLLSDVDGRYRMEEVVRQDAERPRYTQFSLWDSYRGHSALLAEIIPARYHDMVLSMVEYAELTGHLPRWQLATRDPGYMSGDPAVMYVAEGWCRGLLNAEERDRAWNALLATVALRDAPLAAGYLPVEPPATPFDVITGGGREAGTTLEYGLADFALAAMAQTRGDAEVTQQRLQMALNYRHLQDPESGWIRPRDADGNWIEPFQPEFPFGFQEGTSWQYSWLVMHDIAGLIAGMGGADTTAQRLDTFFGFPLNLAPLLWPQVQSQITLFGVFYFGNQYVPGNEHDLQAPYLYNYLGQNWKAQIAAASAAALYTDQANGLPGNDDLGALSGWLVWSMLGVYPINPGLPLFVLGAPEFESAVLHRPAGDFRIDRGAAGFVTAARLNGNDLDSPGFLLNRGRHELALTTAMLPEPAAFPVAPPSISATSLEAFGCGVN